MGSRDPRTLNPRNPVTPYGGTGYSGRISGAGSKSLARALLFLSIAIFFETALKAIGTSDGAGGYTATGTATVTITDLINSVSAVKEITVNFTYTPA